MRPSVEKIKGFRLVKKTVKDMLLLPRWHRPQKPHSVAEAPLRVVPAMPLQLCPYVAWADRHPKLPSSSQTKQGVIGIIEIVMERSEGWFLHLDHPHRTLHWIRPGRFAVTVLDGPVTSVTQKLRAVSWCFSLPQQRCWHVVNTRHTPQLFLTTTIQLSWFEHYSYNIFTYSQFTYSQLWIICICWTRHDIRRQSHQLSFQ